MDELLEEPLDPIDIACSTLHEAVREIAVIEQSELPRANERASYLPALRTALLCARFLAKHGGGTVGMATVLHVIAALERTMQTF